MPSQQELGKLIIKLVAQTDGMKKNLQEATGNVSSFVDKAKKLFAGIGVAVLIKKFASMVKETANMADEMIKTSQRIGTTVEVLSGLQYAADLSGVSFGELTSGVRLFASNMYDASRGMGEGKKAFEALEISTDKLTKPGGGLRGVDEVMYQVADRFKDMQDGAEKTALAQDLFGRSGAALIPLLNKGAEGLREMRQEAEAFGIILDTKTAQAAERFNDNITRMQALSKGFKLSLLKELLPSLEGVTNEMVRQAKESGSLRTALVEGVAFGLKSVATMAVYSYGHLNLFAEVLATILAAGIKLATGDIGSAFRIIKDSVGELNNVSKDTSALIKSIWGELEEVEQAANGVTKSTATMSSGLKEAANNAIGKLDEKISDLKRQYIGLTNPLRASAMALEEFIETATKGAPLTEDLKNKVAELWQEYKKYTVAQQSANIEQAQAAEDIAEANRQIEASLQDVENKYKSGLISLTEYYETKRNLAKVSGEAEIAALQKQKVLTSDVAEQIKIDTQIRDKRAALQREMITLNTKEANTTQALTEKIEELWNASEVSTNRFDRETEATEKHYNDMINQVRLFNDERFNINEEYYTKQEVLAQLYDQKVLEVEKINADRRSYIWMQNLNFYRGINNQIGSLAGQIYDESGQKMEAFFYLQQAARMGEALMNTAAAATNAMATTPGGAATAPAAISLIWSLGMAQIGIILAQTLKGPKKMAAGGLVSEGSGYKDDVLILGKKDEYMMTSEATRYYGTNIMDAIKNMVIPREAFATGMAGGVTQNTFGSNTSYAVNVPVSIENPTLAAKLSRSIEKTVIDILRRYAR